MQLTQATIIIIQAEDSRVITQDGTGPESPWLTLDQDTALGGKYITGAENSPPLSEATTRYFRFKAPAGNYTLYIRYTKNNNDGQQAYANDSFYCSDSSFSETATLAERNNTPQNGLDNVDSHQVYAWCQIDSANSYVQATDGEAYFKIAPREDGWRFDAFAFVSQGETVSNDILNNAPGYIPFAAENPFVEPENEDGTVGTPFQDGADWKVSDLTFHFTAGEDPAGVAPLNPDIVKHNLYLQTGAPTDPNLYFVGSVDQISDTDPAQSIGPLNALTPAVSVAAETTVLWKVEEVLDNGSGGYPDGDPNNIMGPAWSFITAGLTPEITGISDHMLTDAGGNTSFTIQTTVVANNYKWFKVVGDQDVDEEGNFAHVDDDELLDTDPLYEGTTTKTLQITGAASNGSDDGRVYAVAYNGVPGEEGAIVSKPSAARWFWYPRLVNHYAFDETYEETYEVEVEEGVFEERTRTITPDAISGYDMRLLSNDTGYDVPTLEPNIPTAPGIIDNAYSLKFNNPRADDPNAVDAQYTEVPDRWAGIYKDFTISTWVYNSGGGSNWNRILDYGKSQYNFVMLCINPGDGNRNAVHLALRVGGEEGADDNQQTLTTNDDEGFIAPEGEWTHIVATLTGNKGRIYLNGELAAVTSDDDEITFRPVDYEPYEPDTSPRNWLGRSQWGAQDGYFNGQIDELKIYNYALTNVEVGQEYLADTLKEYVCDTESYDLGVYDTNGDCAISLPDFAILAARWLEDDRFHRSDP